MMLMVSRLAQGFAGEIPGLLGHRFDSTFQVVEFLPFAPFLMPLVILLISLDGFHRVDKQGIFASSEVLRRSCQKITCPNLSNKCSVHVSITGREPA